MSPLGSSAAPIADSSAWYCASVAELSVPVPSCTMPSAPCATISMDVRPVISWLVRNAAICATPAPFGFRMTANVPGATPAASRRASGTLPSMNTICWYCPGDGLAASLGATGVPSLRSKANAPSDAALAALNARAPSSGPSCWVPWFPVNRLFRSAINSDYASIV